MIIALVIILALAAMPIGCVILTLCTEDAAGNAGCIEEGQVW
jgi:hypothetical protein